MNSLQRALAVALVVSVGLAAGFLSYRLQLRIRQADRVDMAAAAPPVRAPGADATAADGVGADAPEPAPQARPIPTDVPDLSLPDLSGTARSLHSFVGRPLIINFWATWCAPCRREIPLLRGLLQRYRSERLEIVGVAVDFRTAVQQYLRHTPIDYPLLLGEQDGLQAAEQFGMQMVLPFSVFADSQGHIVAIKVGELHREEADLILTQIRAVDQGRAPLAQARQQIEADLKRLAVHRAQAQQNSD